MAEIEETVPPPGKGARAREPQGKTRGAQGPARSPAPRMPHERDESAHSQAAGEPSQQRMGELGRKDLARGVVDTDKGPALDEAYEKTRKSSANPETKFRR